MTNTVTYHSANAPLDQQWLAYVVLSSGNYWLVRCTGATEQAAIDRACALWETELLKPRAVQAEDDETLEPSISTGRGSHFIGKKWLINVATREKIRVDESEVTAKLASGEWIVGGPRSK
jgi:hypothetical protein